MSCSPRVLSSQTHQVSWGLKSQVGLRWEGRNSALFEGPSGYCDFNPEMDVEPLDGATRKSDFIEPSCLDSASASFLFRPSHSSSPLPASLFLSLCPRATLLPL